MKRPLFRLQYELDESRRYTETGSDNGAKLVLDAINDAEVREALVEVGKRDYKSGILWLRRHPQTDKIAILPITTRTPEALNYRLEGHHLAILFITRPLHTIDKLDNYLFAANRNLETGAVMWCHAMTAVLKRKLIKASYPWGISHLMLAWNYLWHRIFPKLRLTHDFYFAMTGGKKRTFNRVEMLGRIYRAGFEVLDESFIDGEFVVIARKVQEPINDSEPTGSPIIHLRRIGKDGKMIVVHKFRTMYTYSEYIQNYIYNYQSIDSGGKFKDDYRVTPWGHMLRRMWLDELPMVWNILRGEMKLVGVRPLSPQYFSLYSKEMQQLRTKTKPGLLPPFYYDRQTPETIEEVQESERRYIEAYLKKPFATDWRYFWGIVGNIVLKRKRSK